MWNFFFITKYIKPKLIISSLLYLCFSSTMIILFIFIFNNNFLKSRLDPNYWIIEIIKPSNKDFNSKIINLLKLSSDNDKYRTKALINLLYYYNKLDVETKRELNNHL